MKMQKSVIESKTKKEYVIAMHRRKYSAAQIAESMYCSTYPVWKIINADDDWHSINRKPLVYHELSQYERATVMTENEMAEWIKEIVAKCIDKGYIPSVEDIKKEILKPYVTDDADCNSR